MKLIILNRHFLIFKWNLIYIGKNLLLNIKKIYFENIENFKNKENFKKYNIFLNF
jgi:hypothetical protein